MSLKTWIGETNYDKLWGRADLFHQVFRAVDLTKEDFVDLQSDLHHLNPSRNCKGYIAKKSSRNQDKFLTVQDSHPSSHRHH